MGYFSNGTEGDSYYEHYCSRCVHDNNHDCAVWLAHLLYNYDLCNEEKNPLNVLIPRSKDGPVQRAMQDVPGCAQHRATAESFTNAHFE